MCKICSPSILIEKLLRQSAGKRLARSFNSTKYEKLLHRWMIARKELDAARSSLRETMAEFLKKELDFKPIKAKRFPT